MAIGTKVAPDLYQAALDHAEELEAEVATLKAQLAPSEPTEWLEKVMTRRLLVHLKDGATIDGSLVARMDDGVVLRAARLLTDGAAPTSMAGEVFVPRENVAFAQLDG